MAEKQTERNRWKQTESSSISSGPTIYKKIPDSPPAPEQKQNPTTPRPPPPPPPQNYCPPKNQNEEKCEKKYEINNAPTKWPQRLDEYDRHQAKFNIMMGHLDKMYDIHEYQRANILIKFLNQQKEKLEQYKKKLMIISYIYAYLPSCRIGVTYDAIFDLIASFSEQINPQNIWCCNACDKEERITSLKQQVKILIDASDCNDKTEGNDYIKKNASNSAEFKYVLNPPVKQKFN